MSLLSAAAFLSTLFAGLAAPTPQANEPAARVLFIGNSYTYFNNLPAMVSALAEAGGHRLETKMPHPRAATSPRARCTRRCSARAPSACRAR